MTQEDLAALRVQLGAATAQREQLVLEREQLFANVERLHEEHLALRDAFDQACGRADRALATAITIRRELLRAAQEFLKPAGP